MENGAAEEHMKSYLKSGDYNSFLNTYNLFLCSGADSDYSTYFKSIALLCYLANSDSLEYNKLIQNVTFEELNDEYIETVIKVADAILRYDFESFNLILKKCDKVHKPIINKIVQNQQKLIESTLDHDTGDSNAITKVSSDVIESMKDCVFVIKNFNGD